jgi:hypothetical protein
METTTTGKYVAELYVTPSPDAEIIGQGVMAFSQNIRADEMQALLQKHGLTSIQPDEWYSFQLCLDILKAVAESDSNGTASLVAIGMKIIDVMPFPQEITTIPQAIELVKALTRGLTRNLPEGYGPTLKMMDEQHIHLYVNEPNSVELAYGYYWAIASRFKPPYNIFVVRHIPNPNPEEQPGNVYDIKWGVLPSDVE